jgi:hypothetical protein
MLATLIASAASGQDMQFSLAESSAAGGAAQAQPLLASQALARALDHYDHERFAEAAVLLQHVIEGATEDGPAGVQQAQFYLAKALTHLGFDHAALALLDEITRAGRAHAYFVPTLPWLARLAQRMPDSDALLDAVGRFGPADLTQPDSALDREARAQLQLLLGMHAYRDGDPGQAAQLLAAVDRASSVTLRALFLEGVAHVRQRRAQPALRAFREIVRRVDAGDTFAAPEPERMRALAWLSLGRVYYTAALSTHDKRREGKLLGNAVHAWSRVDESSEHWLDALFESAWALFVSDEQARALGNLHALLSPYFAGAFYPEAHLLKSVIFFSSCQLDSAAGPLAAFHERYDPLLDQLRGLLAHDSGGEQLLALMEPAKAGAEVASMPTDASELLRRALADRELQRAVAEVQAIAQEQQALERAPRALRESSAGERIRQDVLVAGSFAAQRARELARARAERLVQELQEVSNQADTVEIEMLHYKRGMLGKRPRIASAKGRSVAVDSEHVLWPFDGEYWRDELGYYRQEVKNRCEVR